MPRPAESPPAGRPPSRGPSRRRSGAGAAAAAALLLLGLPARAPAQSLEARVNRAIDRGVAWLLTQQDAEGRFGWQDPVHPSGRTALALLALLHSGVPSDHPAVRRGLDFLGMPAGYDGTPRHRSTYETSLMALVARALGKSHDRVLHRLAAWLVERFDKGRGLWAYPDGSPDLSNTQFAVYALKAAEERGFRTPDRLWTRLIERLFELQDRDGGFRYTDGVIATGSMTHAGLLALRFASEALGDAAPRGAVRVAERRGQEWFAKRFTVVRNPMGNGWAPGHYYYFMWGLARFGIFFGVDEIAGRPWYRDGAEHLVGIQGGDGGFGNVEDTSFALLFLRRAGLTVSPRDGETAGGDAGPAEPAPAPPSPAPGAPAIREWLVAGPFPSTRGQDDMLLESPLAEKSLQPRRGDPAGKESWAYVVSPEDRLDLAAVTRAHDYAVWYAFTWIHSEVAQELVLWTGSDDGLRVYVDGALVLDGHHHDGVAPDHYRVPIAVREGATRLLFKVENVGYYVHLTARITGPDGRAPAKVSIAVDRRPRR